VSTHDLDFIARRLSAKQNREGIIDAIRSLLWAAEMEEAEDILEAALQAVREERRLHERYWLEWTEDGWREIR